MTSLRTALLSSSRRKSRAAEFARAEDEIALALSTRVSVAPQRVSGENASATQPSTTQLAG